MENYIGILILVPLIGFLLNLVIPGKDEKSLSQASSITMGIQFISALTFTIIWLIQGTPTIYTKVFSLLQLTDFELYVDFEFNSVTVVFLLIGAFIGFLITAYSRKYLHRESGFKRFFATIMFFYLGYNLIVLSGNLASIFIGWEIAGISSFLLIAYYRDRYIPVKNALKIFSIYRLGDVCILLAMWIAHQVWHESVDLGIFTSEISVYHIVGTYPYLSVLFSLCIFTAAAIKSAQFPFSAWLSRAMEGPTPSSAIFYSSLASHLGLLILIRTHDFWVAVPYMKEFVIVLGAFSFIVSHFTARIQPSIKGQIAYLVVGQIGLMFIEVALGWHYIVLIHFASHALLRSYQLLISPSIVAYKIKQQFFEFTPVKRVKLNPFIKKIHNSIYILSLHEWYLDSYMYYLIWSPLKKMGMIFQKVPYSIVKWVSFLALILIPICVIMVKYFDCSGWCLYSIIYGFIGLALVYILRIFTERQEVKNAWYKIGFFHLFIMTAMYFNGESIFYLSFYAVGIAISLLIGHYAFNRIIKNEGVFNITGYNGHSYEHPKEEFWFLISCLGLMGFPITSTFVGVELMLNGVHGDQMGMLFLLLMAFLVNGLAMIRLYSRIFLGPHVKTYHSKANKSA